MPLPISNFPSFDFKEYLGKIEEKTSEIEQNSVTLEQDIEERNLHLVRITQTVQHDLKTIKTRLEGYRAQLELIKKDLFAILKNYKLAQRKDEFNKLAERIECLSFEKNITRVEFQKLIAIRSSKKR
ncbi:MAG: hypothetical protein AABX70_06475 [Nanoarchaeota archaeon]